MGNLLHRTYSRVEGRRYAALMRAAPLGLVLALAVPASEDDPQALTDPAVQAAPPTRESKSGYDDAGVVEGLRGSAASSSMTTP